MDTEEKEVDGKRFHNGTELTHLRSLRNEVGKHLSRKGNKEIWDTTSPFSTRDFLQTLLLQIRQRLKLRCITIQAEVPMAGGKIATKLLLFS
jgi:hypothetical protein